MVDIAKLNKLLNLTTSTFNGEALNAIRKANEELKKEGKRWDEVFEGKSRRSYNYEEMLKRSNVDLVKERDKYKNEVQKAKAEIEDLKRACDFYKYASGLKTENRKTEYSRTEYSKAQPKSYYDEHGRYVPKSKRR